MHTHVGLHTQTERDKTEKRKLNNMIDDNSVSSLIYFSSLLQSVLQSYCVGNIALDFSSKNTDNDWNEKNLTMIIIFNLDENVTSSS